MEEDEVNEILREDYYNCLTALDELYKTNRIILDDKVLEKLGHYLHPSTILEYVGQDRVLNSEEVLNEKRRQKRVKFGKKKLDRVVKSRVSIIPGEQLEIDDSELVEDLDNTPKAKEKNPNASETRFLGDTARGGFELEE